jgi:hypothetical protein
MPNPKSSGPGSTTNGSKGQSQQRIFQPTNLLEEQNNLKERARNRLAELQEIKKQVLAPIEEEEKVVLAILGQTKKVERRQAATSATRTGLRNFIRDALASGQKLRMSEVAQAVEGLGYEPQAGGTLKAVDQALRAMKKQGQVEHLKDENPPLWRWADRPDQSPVSRKKRKG